MQLGANEVDGFKLGASQVEKIFLGANEVWTNAIPPSAITDFACTTNIHTHIEATWSAAIGDAPITYDLYRNNGTLIQANVTSPYQFLPLDLIDSNYYVKAINAAGATNSNIGFGRLDVMLLDDQFEATLDGWVAISGAISLHTSFDGSMRTAATTPLSSVWRDPVSVSINGATYSYLIEVAQIDSSAGFSLWIGSSEGVNADLLNLSLPTAQIYTGELTATTEEVSLRIRNDVSFKEMYTSHIALELIALP